MKKHTNVSRPSVAKPNASKNVALLLAGVSGLALLTGCSLADIKNPFASQRPEQIIPENRRMPVLNTALPSAPPAMAHPEAPMVTTAVPPSARVNVAKKDTAVRKHIPGNPSGTLSRPEMASHAAPVPAEPPVLPTMNVPEPKSIATSGQIVPQEAPKDLAKELALHGNPSPAMDAGPKPVVLGEISSKPIEAKSPSLFDSLFGSSDAPVQEESPAPWKAREQSAPAPQGGHRVSGKERNQVHEEPSDTQVASGSDAGATTPALSSVPPAPVEYHDIKDESKTQFQDLQSEHDKAQQDKNSLMHEPSQQKIVVPDVQPQLTVETKPTAEAQPAKDAPVKNTPESSQITVDTKTTELFIPGAPRRGIDIMTQEQWDALQKARRESMSAPELSAPSGADASAGPRSDAGDSSSAKLVLTQMSNTETVVDGNVSEMVPVFTPNSAESAQPQADAKKDIVADIVIEDKPVTDVISADDAKAAPEMKAPSADHRPFFSGLFGTPASELKSSPVEEAKAPETEKMQAPTIEASAPAAETPVPAEMAAASPSSGLPPVASLAAPSEPVTAKAALPSPKILEEVKMLPPSRYSARAHALQSHTAND